MTSNTDSHCGNPTHGDPCGWSRYDYEFNADDNSTPARICRRVGSEQRVLELGCASGAMSVVLRDHYGCDVIAVETDSGAVEQARQRGVSVLVADLESADWAAELHESDFQVVLTADILEHLQDPLACLRQLRRCLASAGRLVVSVPNIAHGGVVAALLTDAFDYDETGLLDRTHLHFFTATTLIRMLHTAGFTITALETVEAGPKHPEFARHWQDLPPALRTWLANNPVGRGFQIIVEARLSTPADSHDCAAPGLDDLKQRQRQWLTELSAVLQREPATQAELEGMRRSRSWRWTAPLRRVKNAFRHRRDSRP